MASRYQLSFPRYFAIFLTLSFKFKDITWMIAQLLPSTSQPADYLPVVLLVSAVADRNKGLYSRQTDRQTDRQIDRQIDRQTDRQTDRQIDR